MLVAQDLHYSYGREPTLNAASLTIAGGESLALVGPSGAGKTTLLYCLAGLVRPASGSVSIDEELISSASAAERGRIRREKFGFVFQFAELVPELSIQENVELPLRLLGASRRVARDRTAELLQGLGIAVVAGRRAGQISGGQAQRAAVARAVVHSPAYVLADEPTGSLDTGAGQLVLHELLRLCKERGSALVVVTHDQAVAAAMQRRVLVVDGSCHPETEPPGGLSRSATSL